MDPNFEVRRAILNSIAITFRTLPDILDRTRDIRDLVRKQVGVNQLPVSYFHSRTETP